MMPQDIYYEIDKGSRTYLFIFSATIKIRKQTKHAKINKNSCENSIFGVLFLSQCN